MGRKGIDLTGQRFGRLLVIKEAGRDKHGAVLWLCKCSCPLGNEVTVSGTDLREEHTTSCGCYRKECSAKRLSEYNTKHGMSGTRLYRIWKSILQRTGFYKGTTEKHKRDYIDRGITVCEEWKSFEKFKSWAIASGYLDDLQIDRIDNSKGYYPENCQWVSRKENMNNRRCTICLEDGSSFALFCSKVGIKTSENGRITKQYRRISERYRTSRKVHPELLAKANEYLTLLRRLKASLDLLKDVREFRERCKGLQMISLPET